ncbi:MAG: DsbA family protein [Rhodothalassiaceae bacterium]
MLALLLAGAALLLVLAPSSGTENAGTGDAEAAFEARVRAYILAHPEIIPEAIGALKQRERAGEDQRQREAATALWDLIAHDDLSPVLGNPDAAVTFVEFYDYRCSFCRRSYPDVKRLLAEHEDDVRFVFRQFPVIDAPGDSGGVSHIAARAAIAADRQGHFRAFHDALMTAGGRLDRKRILAIAAGIGLDTARLEQDMRDPAIDRYIEDTLRLADAVGINATPTYVFEGRVLTGARGYAALQALIAAGPAATAATE